MSMDSWDDVGLDDLKKLFVSDDPEYNKQSLSEKMKITPDIEDMINNMSVGGVGGITKSVKVLGPIAGKQVNKLASGVMQDSTKYQNALKRFRELLSSNNVEKATREFRPDLPAGDLIQRSGVDNYLTQTLKTVPGKAAFEAAEITSPLSKSHSVYKARQAMGNAPGSNVYNVKDNVKNFDEIIEGLANKRHMDRPLKDLGQSLPQAADDGFKHITNQPASSGWEFPDLVKLVKVK